MYLDLDTLADEWQDAIDDLNEDPTDEYAESIVVRMSALAQEFSCVFDPADLRRIPDNNGPVVAESMFEDYARQLAEDLGAIDQSAGWPSCHIDWEAAAESLQMDYTSISWDGETYYYREG